MKSHDNMTINEVWIAFNDYLERTDQVRELIKLCLYNDGSGDLYKFVNCGRDNDIRLTQWDSFDEAVKRLEALV
jgi:hypothetical protein